jgi:hypothetical protein
MWRLLLSGLFCVPALVLLLLSRNDNSSQESHTTLTPSAFAQPSAVAPAIHVSLPAVQFSTEPALPDPYTLDGAGLTMGLPSQAAVPEASSSDLPIRHRVLNASSRHVAGFAPVSRSKFRGSDHSEPFAFLSRNLTKYSFALPDQNGGG